MRERREKERVEAKDVRVATDVFPVLVCIESRYERNHLDALALESIEVEREGEVDVVWLRTPQLIFRQKWAQEVRNSRRNVVVNKCHVMLEASKQLAIRDHARWTSTLYYGV